MRERLPCVGRRFRFLDCGVSATAQADTTARETPKGKGRRPGKTPGALWASGV